MTNPKKEILAISRRAENALCCDCRMPQPTWASFNLGLFMCMTCAGHHRSLGVHITKVRSVTMDNWDPASVVLMGSVGNVRGNTFWEARLMPHQRLHPGVDDRTLSDFIRNKYQHKQWYGAPAGGVASAEVASGDAKPLSKMEQRQARLQARAAVTPSAPTPQLAAASTVLQPSSMLRQSSTPVPSSQGVLSGTAAALFSGMTISSSSTPSLSVSASPTPSKPPAKEHSASPWVSRSEHQQVVHQQQQVLQPPQHHHHHALSQPPAAAQSVVNLLDFSASAPTEAPAAAHAVDDMFAGLSVSNGGASAGLGSMLAPPVSNELLSNFYAFEPASAPARAQHSPVPSPQPVHTPVQQEDMFGFIQQPAEDAPASLYPAAPVASSFSSDVGSSFSFMAEDSTAPSLASSSDSAFTFMGGDANGSASLPDMNTLIVLPGSDFGAMPMMPLMDPASFGGMPLMQPMQPMQHMQPMQPMAPHANFLAPMSNPLHHSHSQPLYGFDPQPHGMAPQASGYFPGGGHSTLAPLPPFPSSSASPSLPQFTVQSVQATARAQAQFAHEVANDPFAHIQGNAALAAPASTPLQPLGAASPMSTLSQRPKQPHECDVDGCDGKKVSRGLCSKHLRAETAPAAAPAPPTHGSSFEFLSANPVIGGSPLQTQDSSFSFLASSAPAADPLGSFGSTEQSSFAFI